MKPREIGNLAVRFVTKGLVVLTVFIVLYAAYSHAASVVALRDYKLASYAELLDSDAALSRFRVVEEGGLSHEVSGGALRVHGTAPKDANASVRFVGPTQRLDDLVQATIRYRIPKGVQGAFDVFVGLESADKEPTDPDARRITMVMRNGAPERFAIQGDITTGGPRRIAATPSPLTSDAGAEQSKDDAAEWHDLALELASYVRIAFGLADGQAVASETSHWWMGSRVRLVFGVVARERGTNVDVEFMRASYEQRDRPSTLPPFTDRFGGKLVDPRLWTAILPAGFEADVAYHTDPAHGLQVQARSKDHAGFQPALTLLSTPTVLGSFTLRTRIDARKLKDASAVFGVIGSGYAPSRFIDVGVHGDENGRLASLVVGHWKANAQLSYLADSARWTRPEAVVELKYDAANGTITCWIDGDRVMREHFDLFPGDTIQLRVSVTLQSANGEADVAFREVSYDR